VRELPDVMTFAGWGADSKSLLATGYHEGTRGAYRIDLETGAPSLIVRQPDSELPFDSAAWSADGKSLFLVRHNGQRTEFSLVRHDVASGQEKELLRKPFIGSVFGFSISPDGSYLTVASVDAASNSRTMLLVPTAGGNPREVMRVPSGVEPSQLGQPAQGQAPNAPSWSPDGAWFLLRNKQGEIWQAPVDGSPRKLPNTLDPNILGFRLHPDGKTVVYVLGPAAQPRFTEIWALENFLPGAK
jgi:Tol biopolymer transport system component